MKAFVVLGLTLAWICPAYAGQPDFYLIHQSCKAIGARTDAGGGVSDTMPGASSTWGCEYKGKRKVSCNIVFTGTNRGEKPKRIDLAIDADAANTVVLTYNKSAEWVWINRTSGIVVTITRAVEPTFVVTKVCQGEYLTGDEWRILEAQDKKAK